MSAKRIKVKKERTQVVGQWLTFATPRPESRGSCDCEPCRAMAARLQREAA